MIEKGRKRASEREETKQKTINRILCIWRWDAVWWSTNITHIYSALAPLSISLTFYLAFTHSHTHLSFILSIHPIKSICVYPRTSYVNVYVPHAFWHFEMSDCKLLLVMCIYYTYYYFVKRKRRGQSKRVPAHAHSHHCSCESLDLLMLSSKPIFFYIYVKYTSCVPGACREMWYWLVHQAH